MLSLLSYPLALAIATGPCDLVDKATAAQLLGAPVTTVMPSGPAPDEDTGGTMSSCVYQAGERMLIIVRVDYPSAAAANDAAKEEMSPEKLAEEGTTATPESGIGDKAWLGHTKSGLQYSVLKGATALSLAIGPISPGVANESQLRAATAAAVKKL